MSHDRKRCPTRCVLSPSRLIFSVISCPSRVPPRSVFNEFCSRLSSLCQPDSNRFSLLSASGGVSIKIKALPPKSPPKASSPEATAHSPSRSSSSSDGSSYAHRHKKFREKRHHHKKFSRPNSPVSTPTPPAVPPPVVSATPTHLPPSQPVLQQQQLVLPQSQVSQASMAPHGAPSHPGASRVAPRTQTAAANQHMSRAPPVHPSVQQGLAHAGHRAGGVMPPHPQHSSMPNYAAAHGTPSLFGAHPPGSMPPNAANFAPPHTQFTPSIPPIYPPHTSPAPHPYYRSMYSHRQ